MLGVLRGGAGGGAIKEPPLMHHSQKFRANVLDDVQPGVELLAGFHQMKRKKESEDNSFPHFLIDGIGWGLGRIHDVHSFSGRKGHTRAKEHERQER